MCQEYDSQKTSDMFVFDTLILISNISKREKQSQKGEKHYSESSIKHFTLFFTNKFYLTCTKTEFKQLFVLYMK